MIILEHEYDRLIIDFPELNLSPSMEIEEEDLSGNSSGSLGSPGGIKPWIISLSFLVPDTRQNEIKNIMRCIRKTDDQLAAVEWIVTNNDINILDILKVKFYGQVSVKKSDNLEARVVSFSLKEVTSVPERTEIKKSEPFIKINNDNVDSEEPTMVSVSRKLTTGLYDPYSMTQKA